MNISKLSYYGASRPATLKEMEHSKALKLEICKPRFKLTIERRALDALIKKQVCMN